MGNQHDYTDEFRLEVVKYKFDTGASHAKTAAHFNINQSSSERWWRKYKYNFQEDYDRHAPEGHYIKGISKLVDADGNVKQQWIKTDKTKEDLQKLINATIDHYSKDIPALTPSKAAPVTNKDLLAQYTLTDFHFGMLAWKEQSGTDWNMNIARQTYVDFMQQAMDRTPDCNTAILANIGDLMHFDGLIPVTPTSGHVLPTDVNYDTLVDIVLDSLQWSISELLHKHENVHLIMAEGNHDLAGSAWLRQVMRRLYRDEPRLTVDTNQDPFYGYVWGVTGLIYHHGHLVKPNQIQNRVYPKFRELFKNCKFIEAHTGHYHNETTITGELMRIRQHATLAGADTYTSRIGYNDIYRHAQILTYHLTRGWEDTYCIRPY